MIHPEKIKYINRESLKLVESVVERIEERGGSMEAIGSIKEKYAHQIKDVIGDSEFSTTNHRNEKIAKWITDGKKSIGFDSKKFPAFNNFLENIYKDKYLRKVTTKSFVEKTVFHWIVKTYRLNQASESLSNFLELELQENIQEYRFCFSVLNLELEGALKINDVDLRYIEKKDIEHLKSMLENRGQSESYFHLEKELAGKVVLECKAKAEHEKAKEIAYEKCCTAMDVLMLCSDPAFNPELHLNFDIDSRLAIPRESDYLIFNRKNEMTRSMEGMGSRHFISKEYVSRLQERGISYLGTFISNYNPENELSRLILISMKSYSRALLIADYNKRVADIFSILESLILPHDDSPILENLKKYIPKLITKDIDQRKSMVAILSRLYKVRSKKVHHGIDSKINIDDLRLLQLILNALILSFITKNEDHSSKATLLQEIDDALDQAY